MFLYKVEPYIVKHDMLYWYEISGCITVKVISFKFCLFGYISFLHLCFLFNVSITSLSFYLLSCNVNSLHSSTPLCCHVNSLHSSTMLLSFLVISTKSQFDIQLLIFFYWELPGPKNAPQTPLATSFSGRLNEDKFKIYILKSDVLVI